MDLPIPIYILTPGSKVPDEVCYLITKDGVFLNKKAGLITAMVKVEGICFLESVKPTAKIHLPKIPASVMAQALSFFCRIHDDLDSEANLMLHYSEDQKRFEFSCPLQVVTCASAKYKASERLEGYQLVGTIHSHNTMSAFHSGTDDSDEEYFDGLHLTVGRINKFPEFSISCSVMVNGQRFKLEPEEVIDGLTKVEVKITETKTTKTQPRENIVGDLVEAVEVVGDALFNPLGGNFERYKSYTSFTWGGHEEQFYVVGSNEPPAVFPAEWLEKVRRRRFFGGSGLVQAPLDVTPKENYWGRIV